jgi:hypothetical protein
MFSTIPHGALRATRISAIALTLGLSGLAAWADDETPVDPGAAPDDEVILIEGGELEEGDGEIVDPGMCIECSGEGDPIEEPGEYLEDGEGPYFEPTSVCDGCEAWNGEGPMPNQRGDVLSADAPWLLPAYAQVLCAEPAFRAVAACDSAD